MYWPHRSRRSPVQILAGPNYCCISQNVNSQLSLASPGPTLGAVTSPPPTRPPEGGVPQRRVGGGGEPGCGCLRGKGGEEGGEGGEGETPSIGGRVVGDKPPIQLLKCAVQ